MKTSKLMSAFYCAARSLFLGGVLSGFAMLVAAADGRPNVIFIMVDDMGYADLGVTGGRNGSTPYIDELANEGVLLTDGYASAAVCSPTRTALMTGKYRERFEVGLPEPLSVEGLGLPKDIPTFASVFKDRGYETHLIGKWHLGAPPEYGPLNYGYDRFLGFHPGGSDYYQNKLSSPVGSVENLLHRDEKPVEPEGYLTEVFANEAVRIIEGSAEDKPFLISLHFNAPHWPWQGPFDEEEAGSVKDSFHYDGGSLKKYREMMTYMDHSVGRVLAALHDKGIEDNTIVVFTSDNGGERFSDTWPYAGYKGSLLEGGIRAPIIIRWPGKIAAGEVSQQVMVSMDFLPTLVAATGKAAEGEFDGTNLLPVLTGEAPEKERTIYWRYFNGEQAAVRQGDWKYFKSDGKEWLFNVKDNPRERTQLKDKHLEKFAELKALWDQWNSEMLPYPDGKFISGRVKDSNP